MAATTPLLKGKTVILALSGGVDSAVAAILLQNQGADVKALHMTNWSDDDGYCSAAADLQDARTVCDQLEIPLHHVNFSREYREQVFAAFLQDYTSGRTPNPDVLCNREIKFGSFLRYARRLGGDLIATGHYARTAVIEGRTALLKARDNAKDQSYFLHAVSEAALATTVFPLGEMLKDEVRRIAADHALPVHDKKDSTGICFIGERPFREFLSSHLDAQPGEMRTPEGEAVGRHEGLPYYTPGQRQGLGIGGRKSGSDAPWYVVGKDLENNALIVAQGEHPLRFSVALLAADMHWIGGMPAVLRRGESLPCAVKIRYRQADRMCTVENVADGMILVNFEQPEADVAPGQFAVLYDGPRCLGGGAIERAVALPEALRRTG